MNGGPTRAREAQRQQVLLEAIARADTAPWPAGLRAAGQHAETGLRVYRANAHALAERALAAVFPTLQSLLGREDFKHLAREHWRGHPPQRGDIGEWGEGLAAWLELHAGLQDWPYLADCARLDWLRHVCERAEDSALDAVSLNLLQSHDPGLLKLVLQPGMAVLSSRWPIATLFEAHRLPERGFAVAREAIAERRAEAVLVVRQGWRAEVLPLEATSYAWFAACLRGESLQQALQLAGADFDFSAWLAQALQQEWLRGAALLGA